VRYILLVCFLFISANAKWIMHNTNNPEAQIFIYNDETGEAFLYLPGGFIRVEFGDELNVGATKEAGAAIFNKPRKVPSPKTTK
jgi:uncharacterized RmlC-like cupin family protein